MRHLATTLGFLTAAAAMTADVRAGAVLLTFDDVSSLSEYASLGVTFSSNASIWTSSAPSVFDDPNGGAVSVPNALQFGNAGGVLGSIFFAVDVSEISVFALSGPGPDTLSSNMWIKAFDQDGTLLDQDIADTSLQYDLLSVSGTGIRRLDLYSPTPQDDVWDNFRFTPVPEPASVFVFGSAITACCAVQRRRQIHRSGR